MRHLLGLALLAVLATPLVAGDPPDPRRILYLLRYVAKDYPKAVAEHEAEEIEEQEGFLKEARYQLALLPDRPGRASLEHRVTDLIGLLKKSAPPRRVTTLVGQAASELSRLYPAPLTVPTSVSRARGQELYKTGCASCHGLDGRAEGLAALEMKPRPARFVDPKVMSGLSPAGIYDAVTFGVTGTPMPSFQAVFSDQDRWDLAFYVFTLRTDPPDPDAVPAAPLPLERLGRLTDTQLEKLLRKQGVSAARLPGARQALRTSGTYR